MISFRIPRQSRIDTTGALHHIIAREIERRRIFEDDQDRYDFVKNLGLIPEQTVTTCYAWSLIPNHFHLYVGWGRATMQGTIPVVDADTCIACFCCKGDLP